MYRAPACFVQSRNLQQARATCWCRGLYQISRTLAMNMSRLSSGQRVRICDISSQKCAARRRSTRHNSPSMMFLAFDLLHQDGADLRSETLSQRKRALDRLCRGARVPTSTRSRVRWAASASSSA
jgi:hypothetical protein